MLGLVIIDVQNAILAGCGTPDRQPQTDRALDQTVRRLQTVRDRARAAGIPVIIVQHDGRDGHRLAVGTDGWAVRQEIAPAAGDTLVHKTECDAFFATDLHERLKELGVDHIVVGGCMTQFCIDTTVRRAVSLGYDVTLVADGHTTADSGGLRLEQIIAHHNMTLDGFGAGGRLVGVRPAEAIRF
ncbi:cysteine hydrolase family protein [Azospirillum picis]|uniref:Nicotinamidase-related amidase n=1 Tax=Azospirillum picis TaxID=488438 RepID=A0ABU0MJ69_9PROT|nr:cysteine hydrolase family protein [Azospirillum picis]MBP2299452.1 nicotinamidase-related amidase [Azospirillum picis]MDQ0533421.1 nicotinamidase-related amidase [Azospirillum picis]